MAKVIRSPRVIEDPRRLHAEARKEILARHQNNEMPVDMESGVETIDDIIPTAPLKPEFVDPVISPEELQVLRECLENAEHRASSAAGQLDTLKAEIAETHENARQEGYSIGHQSAQAEVKEEFKQQFEVMDRLSKNLSDRLENLIMESEDLIVETIYAGVVKIVGDALVEPENISKLVKHIAGQLIRPGEFVVKLSQADYELVKDYRPELLEEVVPSHVKIISDSNIELGGCILESASGSLDARLETQLKRLKEILLEGRAKRQSELLSGKRA